MRSLHGRLILPAMLAVGFALSGGPAAFAGDFSFHHGSGHHGFVLRGHGWHGHPGRWHGHAPSPLPVERVAYRGYAFGGYGVPSRVPGIGTFAGGIEAVSDYGNGVYFATDGSFCDQKRSAPPPPDAKIINVKPDLKNGGCSMEHGVCVIRP